MYTTHGHQIVGTTVTRPHPARIARCGGPGLCGQCSKEAQAVLKDAVGTPVTSGIFRKRFLVYIKAARWFRNGDHPDDKVGELVVDWVRFAEQRPELLGVDYPLKEASVDDKLVIINDRTNEIVETHPPSYPAIEGRVVRFFRRPELEYSGGQEHVQCGYTWHDHGWIDMGNITVCPGDWVLTGEHGERWKMKNEVFLETYDRVGDL